MNGVEKLLLIGLYLLAIIKGYILRGMFDKHKDNSKDGDSE